MSTSFGTSDSDVNDAAALDERTREVERRVDQQPVRIEHLATREDLEKAKNSIRRWLIASQAALVVAMAAMLRLQ